MPVTPVMGIPTINNEVDWGAIYQNTRWYWGPHYASYDFRATQLFIKLNDFTDQGQKWIVHLLTAQSSEIWHTPENTGHLGLEWVSWAIDTPVWIVRGQPYYFGTSGRSDTAGTGTIRGRLNTSLGYTYRRGCTGVPSYPDWGTWGTTNSTSTFGPALAYVTDGKAIMGALPGGRNTT